MKQQNQRDAGVRLGAWVKTPWQRRHAALPSGHQNDTVADTRKVRGAPGITKPSLKMPIQ